MAEECGPCAMHRAEGAQSRASAWSGHHSSCCITADGLRRMRGGLQGHPVMNCSHFGSLPSRAVGMAWELLSIMSGMVCCSGLGSFCCLRIKRLMVSMALGQGGFAMSVLPLLMDLMPFSWIELVSSANRKSEKTSRVPSVFDMKSTKNRNHCCSPGLSYLWPFLSP